MGDVIISGIQQVGLGVTDVHAAFKWYRRQIGLDVPVFSDAGEAGLMQRYTGGRPWTRHAILAVNMNGGSGLEIWQYIGRVPQPPPVPVTLGDLGINLIRIKSRDVERTHRAMLACGLDVISDVVTDPSGGRHFLLRDPWGNPLDIVQGETWFARRGRDTGGVCGALIGVRDITAARRLYSDVLGYDHVGYDQNGVFADLASLPGGDQPLRRVLLGPSGPRQGSLSRLIGASRLELVQRLEGDPRRVFKGRYWGDLGYIHLCFDVNGMAALRERCEAAGFPFTVDSSESFEMGDTAGHFSYVEDPDGTLVEFVETHRIPIFKKFGLYLDLRKRDPRKPLPDWMVKMLGLGRVRD